jgi:hypothetical protein
MISASYGVRPKREASNRSTSPSVASTSSCCTTTSGTGKAPVWSNVASVRASSMFRFVI